MNNETLQILIQPRTDVNDCMNANTRTFELKSRNRLHYQFDLALPCTDPEICRLMSMYVNFEYTSAERMNEYIIRYREKAGELKSVSIFAKTPLDAKSIFAESNKAKVLTCTKAGKRQRE